MAGIWQRMTRLPIWLFAMVLALLVRLPLLSSSFWLDEAAQALESGRPWALQFDLAPDFQPPLFHVWLFVIEQFGHQEWWLRLASLVPGVISVGLMTFVGEKFFSKKTAFFVGLLLATSELLVYFSQELRPYMLAVMWLGLATLAFFSFWRSQEFTKKRFWLIIFTLANAAAMLTSYVTIFALPIWFLAAFIQKRRIKPIFWSLVNSSIFFLMWFPGLLSQLAVAKELRRSLPGWESVVSLPQAKALALIVAKFIVGQIPVDFTLWDGLLIGLPLLTAAVTFFLVWKQKTEQRQMLALAVMGLLPLLIAWVFSFWIPVLEPKRILYILPWLYLLLAFAASRVKIGPWLTAILLAINLLGLARYWNTPSLQRENWRGLVNEIESVSQPRNTVVVFAFDAPFAPWRWYQKEGLPTVSTGLEPLQTEAQAELKLQGIEQYENVVVFDYLRDLTDPQHFIDQALQKKGYQEIHTLDYPNIGFVRLFYRQNLFAYSE